MRRASGSQRQRLHDTFSELCRIESPSGDERRCADWVKAELEGLGLAVDEDGAAGPAGANAGNLLARAGANAGPDKRSVMLCAHLDTVPPTAPIEPVVDNGAWTNANPGILGADNKAAVAVLVEVARIVQGGGEPPAAVELVFTVSEENGLHGAKAFDLGKLRSSVGFVFDQASPIGQIVIASPTYQRVSAEFKGRAVHAGLHPEDGRNAIAAAARGIASLAVGRLDEETTCNIGTISGGTAANVVAERCVVAGEARSLSEPRVEQVVTEMVDAFQDAADAAECDLDIEIERMFSGYRLKSKDPGVELASRALSGCGFQPQLIATGGGSDANAFRVRGFACVNLANGTERNHEPDERVSVDALEGMLEVALALVDEAGKGQATA